MFRNFDYGKNVLNLYVDFDYDENKTLLSQIDLLKEDLIQIQYKNGYIIDVGWYPEFSKKGLFKIFVIKNCNICVFKTCKNIDELKITLRWCIDKFQG